jgi:hypothetical protein
VYGRPIEAAGAASIAALMVVAWLAGDRTAQTALLLLLAGGGAAAVWLLGRKRPVWAVTIAFGLSCVSRLVIELPVGSLRLEQPALLALIATTVLTGRMRLSSLPPAMRFASAAILVYLLALAASSALIAPEPLASLRMVVWWSISAVSGLAAYLLIGNRPQGSRDGFVGVGLMVAAMGVAAAGVFLALGPEVSPGVQDAYTLQPRVFGPAFEANLYASLVASLLLLALGATIDHRADGSRTFWWLPTVALAAALPLGGTRAAWIGVALGIIVIVVMLALGGARRDRTLLRATARTCALAATGLLVGFGAASLLLPNNIVRAERSTWIAIAFPSSSPADQSPVAEGGSSAPADSGSGQPKPGSSAAVESQAAATPSPTPSPTPSLAPISDTIAFRAARIGPAIDDFATSPIIGLGASSFGQRHSDASQNGAPDHLPILALAVPYESGIVGALALLLGIAVILFGLLRSGATASVALRATVLASFVCLLAAYQATNALHFASNWLLLGLAASAGWGTLPRPRTISSASPSTQPVSADPKSSPPSG